MAYDAERDRHQDPEATSDRPAVGRQVRTLRRLKQKTLQQLAEEAGLSIGYLSQVERDKSSPSINALHQISRALSVNITYFFTEGDQTVQSERYVLRADQRKELSFESGITDVLLSGPGASSLELLWCEFEPGSTSGEESYSHTGEEAGVVVAGVLALCIDDQWNILEAGDSFSFPSHLPHRYRNPSNRKSTVVWAITPPTY